MLFVSMNHNTYLAVLVAALSAQSLVLLAQPSPSLPAPSSHVTIQGSVFCDVCYANDFTNHSYFLPGAEVHIQCKFKADAPGTTEQIAFTVTRTTNRNGMYKLDIPYIEGIDCVEDPSIRTVCQASLMGSSASACNVPGLKSTSDLVTVKSKGQNLCTYSLSALSYRPRRRNVSLCRGGTYRRAHKHRTRRAASTYSGKGMLETVCPHRMLHSRDQFSSQAQECEKHH